MNFTLGRINLATWTTCRARLAPPVGTSIASTGSSFFKRYYIPSSATHLRQLDGAHVGQELPQTGSASTDVVPTETKKRWSVQEQERLEGFVKEGKPCFEIQEHFPGRSLEAIAVRMSAARSLHPAYQTNKVYSDPVTSQPKSTKRWSVQEQEKLKGFVKEGKAYHEIHKHFPGRTLNALSIRMSRFRNPRVRKQQENRTGMSVPRIFSRRGWTEEEDEILKRLKAKYEGVECPWTLISNEGIQHPELNFTRNAMSCRRRWDILFPGEGSRAGHWTQEEDRLMMEAIAAQVGPEFKIELVLDDPAHEMGKSQIHVPIDPDGLKPLHLGAPDLAGVSWKKVAAYMRTRSDVQCRIRFYRKVKSKRNIWKLEEIKRMAEAYRVHGDQWVKVAIDVGHRTPAQVYSKFTGLNKKFGSSEKVEKLLKVEPEGRWHILTALGRR